MGIDLDWLGYYDIMGDDIATLKGILEENVNSLECRIWVLLNATSQMTLYGLECHRCDTLKALEAFKDNAAYVCDHFKTIVNEKYKNLAKLHDGKE